MTENIENTVEKRNFINGYYLLEQDLKEIFLFVEPTKDNYRTYSHRLYELFVRACTEFEANCKAILVENGITLPAYPNISNYFAIQKYDPYNSINNYRVKLQLSQEIDLSPLEAWGVDKAPIWYKEYN